MNTLIRFAAFAVLIAAPAQAADLGGKAPQASAPEATSACADADFAPTDAFGFASGSDVAAPGDKGVGLEYSGAYGARGGSAQAHGLKLGFSYGLIPCLEIGPSATAGLGRVTDRAADTTTTTRAYGAGLEVKYKLLTRERHGFGLTLSVEPTIGRAWTRFDDRATPQFLRGDGPVFGTTAKLLIDRTLIADTLFAAFNVEQAASFLKDNGLDCATASAAGWCRGSSLTLRGALTYKLADGLFLGVDAAHQRAYDGAFLNRAPGHAWFAGPNLFWQINKQVSFNAAWSTQLQGKAPGQTAGSLNLDQFNRQIVKAKIAVGF